jgi:hypothetical protein
MRVRVVQKEEAGVELWGGSQANTNCLDPT